MAISLSTTTVGNKESVEDVIHRLYPEDTPFLTSIGKKEVRNIVYSWPEKALLDPTLNAQTEGADAVTIAVRQPVLRTNTTQILSEAFAVSGTVGELSLYGRKSEMAEGLVDAGIYLKRALEFSCVGSKQTMDTSAVRKFAGVQAQIDAGNVIVTGAPATPISEDNINAAMLKLYRAGAVPKVLMITPEDGLTVANFMQSAGRQRHFDTSDKKITNVVNLYVGPNGTVSVSQNRFLAAGDSLIYNPDNWKLVVLRPWSTKPLAKTGDSEKVLVVGEYGLEHTNTKASVVIRRSA